MLFWSASLPRLGFHHRHTQELGSYIKRLLELRKLSTQDNPEEYAEAVQDEADYNEQFKIESEKNIYQLDDDQRLEIKKAYRQASQICHPDRVSEDMKDVAQETFIKLNEAYKNNDIEEVKRILTELRKGMFKPRSETVSESEQLKAIIKTLTYKIEKLEKEIFIIKDSEDYQTIHSIDDWDAYFDNIKAQLIEEIDYLETNTYAVDDDIPF